MCTGGSGVPPQNSNGGNCDKIKIRVKLDFQRNFPTAAEADKGSEFLSKQAVHNTLKAHEIDAGAQERRTDQY